MAKTLGIRREKPQRNHRGVKAAFDFTGSQKITKLGWGHGSGQHQIQIDPQNPCKNLGVVVHTWNSSIRRQDRQFLGGGALWPANLDKSVSSLFSERHSLKMSARP